MDGKSTKKTSAAKKKANSKKDNRPVLAICYDFDKTLSPTDMQAQGYIQSLGIDVDEFWKETNKLADENDMDSNLAYMFKMNQKVRGIDILNKELLLKYGSKIKLFKGVKTWFKRIKEYGNEHGVNVEHYIISSGLKEMIEGTQMAKDGDFTKIYASSFYYDESGVAVWPAQAIDYTSKTQYLYRIEKGVLDVNDKGVNRHFEPEDFRVPFRNIVYIGDSDTDIPCMKLVNINGGYSIGVYDPKTKNKEKVKQMLRDNRIKLYTPADYSEDSELDKYIKYIIDKTEVNEKIERKHAKDKKEAAEKCSK